MQCNIIKRIVNISSVVLFALCVAAGAYLWHSGAFRSVEALQMQIDAVGGSAPVLFVCLQIIQVVVPVLPGGVSILAGVFLFGPWQGFFYNYIGIVLGSMLAFALARTFGKPLLAKLFSKKLHDKYEKWTTENHKFPKLFAIAMFLPGLPDDFICFLAGTTGMSWQRFTTILILTKPMFIAAYSVAFAMGMQLPIG